MQGKEADRATDATIEKRIFTDPIIPAFFKTVDKPFTITHKKNPTTNFIEWEVTGYGIDAALQELFNNPTIPIMTFIKEWKVLRQSIFALKGDRK
jgi:hypothetical protein